jgi:hypothetical protein
LDSAAGGTFMSLTLGAAVISGYFSSIVLFF